MQIDRTEGSWNGERATVDLRASRRRGQRFYVTSDAAHFNEQGETFLSCGTAGELRIAAGRFRGAHEACEAIDIGKAVGAGLVIGFRSVIANIGYLIGLQAVGDAHFVEVRIAGEREQAGVLVLPAEAADAHLSGSFHDGDIKDLTADLSV